MQMNDQQLSVAILAAISALPEPGIAELFMEGGKLEVNFKAQHAQLWPGMRMDVQHPLPKVAVDPDESQYLIASIAMWLPPYPEAQMAHQKILTCKGWDILFAWARQMFVKSAGLWIQHLREIEESAIVALSSLAVSPERS